jgi:type I restriction enzyme, S subunit
MENGKIAVVPPLVNNYGFGSTEFHVIRPHKRIESKYIYYFLSRAEFRKEAARHMTGAVGLKRVPTDFLIRSVIPLPATEEDQKKIVAEIEEHFSRLDEAVTAMKRIQANLKRYKAAVLKAAVEGKLTEQWRKEHPDVEPGDQLLKRILAERRIKWEDDESAKMRVKGIKSNDALWKKRYAEPPAPDTANLPILPERWVWSTLEQLLCFMRNGISAKPDAETGLPILRISAIRPMLVKIDDVRYLSSNEDKYLEFALSPGDLLFTRYNGNPDLVGVCGVVPELYRTIVHPDKLIRCKLASPELIPKYVANMANIGPSRGYLTQRVRTTAGQAGISGTDLRGMPIPLPPHREQKAIMDELDSRLTTTEKLEATIGMNLKRAERLRQTILQKAFSGELVKA